MRVWAVVLSVLVLAAAAWPVPAPPVRPEAPAAEETEPIPAVVPSMAPTEPERRKHASRDPRDPQPPPEPPPSSKPTRRYGRILGCVEDEDGCAVTSFRISARTFG